MPRQGLAQAPRGAVFIGHALRHHEHPGILDEFAHLVRVNGGETDMHPHPEVAEVGLARQRELLRLGLDQRVAPLLGEREPMIVPSREKER